MLTKIFRVALLFTACAAGAPPARGQNPPPPPPKPLEAGPTDLGRFDGVNYVHDFFGVSIAVPQDWHLISGAQRGAMIEETKKILKTDDARRQQQLEASVLRSTVLLGLTKLPAGSKEGFNASFLLIAERVPTAIMRDGADVIRSMEKGFQNTALTVEFQGPVRTERVGGADFGVATARMSAPHGTFMQKFYVTIKKGFALQLVYTYVDEADLPAFDAMVRSLSLK